MSIDTFKRSENEIIEPRVSFEEIPLWAIRQRTKEKLSLLLSPEKVLVNEDGYFRDWRGLFALTGLTQSEFTVVSQSSDKTQKLIELWIMRTKDSKKVISITQLQECLATIDRYDVHDDTQELLIEDAKFFLTRKSAADKTSDEITIFKADPDNDIITIQDLERSEKGLPLKTYDAFVIYNDKDVEFASELIERCEGMGYSLCVKDRDLLGGLSFESDAILNLLSTRCNRLIVIVSRSLLESPMLTFMTNFAQALGIEQGKRKIIPCLLEPCDLPQMLRFCFRLDYYRNNKLFDFWDKLDKSLKATTSIDKSSLKSIERKSTSDIEVSQINLKLSIPQTPTQLYNEDQVYKFATTPTTPEKSKKAIKTFFMKKSSPPEVKKQIMPPLPRLRKASSQADMSCHVENGNATNIKNSLSQSTFHLNDDSVDLSTLDPLKKRKKWYKMFLPPKQVKLVKSAFQEQPVIESREKRSWYKIKKKKKEKIAMAVEN